MTESPQDPNAQNDAVESIDQGVDDPDAGPATQPTGAAAYDPDEDEDQDSGPGTEPPA